MSRKEQNTTGFVLSTIGGLLIALEIVIVIAICFCCKESLESLRKKNKKDGNSPLITQTAQSVPTAQPVYPPQQPSYAPQQHPGYAPQQPSYVPQQPSYVPQQPQPSYVPQQQPGYVPQQQPGYAPQQQPGYAPQYGYVSQ